MTTIVRLSTDVDDPDAHFECLENARNCLFAFSQMLELSNQSLCPKRCASSLAWYVSPLEGAPDIYEVEYLADSSLNRVVPIFPLRPVYFVFSNIVQTSDALDLKLLQDISKHITIPAQKNHSIMEVGRLCSSLVDKYTEFAEKIMYAHRYRTQGVSSQNNVRHSAASFSSGSRNGPSSYIDNIIPQSMPMDTSTEPSIILTDYSEDVQAAEDQAQLIAAQQLQENSLALFNQQVDWELFYSQHQIDMFDVAG